MIAFSFHASCDRAGRDDGVFPGAIDRNRPSGCDVPRGRFGESLLPLLAPIPFRTSDISPDDPASLPDARRRRSECFAVWAS